MHTADTVFSKDSLSWTKWPNRFDTREVHTGLRGRYRFVRRVNLILESPSSLELDESASSLELDESAIRFLVGSGAINGSEDIQEQLGQFGQHFNVQRFILYRPVNNHEVEIVMMFSTDPENEEHVGDILPIEDNPNLRNAIEQRWISQVPVDGMGIDVAFALGNGQLVFGMDTTDAARWFTQEEILLLKPLADSIMNAYNAGKALHAAGSDGLTGLNNRRALDMAIDNGVDIFGSPIQEIKTIAFFDIDHFKKFNTDHGHDAGDAVLRGFAQILAKEIKALGGTVYRYGGEEFVAIFPFICTQEQIDGIRKSVETTAIGYREKMFNITSSIGFSTAHHNNPPQQLVKRADQAVYASKDGGRNLATEWWVDAPCDVWSIAELQKFMAQQKGKIAAIEQPI